MSWHYSYSSEKVRWYEVLPHMGWNTMVNMKKDDSLLDGINRQDSFYFVHGFAPEVDAKYTLAECQYGKAFSAIIKKDNFYGVQFHPEKSGAVGERLLENFINGGDL